MQRYLQIIKAMVGDAVRAPLANVPTDAALDEWVRCQQTSGAFLAPDPSVSPEARWFDEMVILHALANRAVAGNDPAIDAAVQKAAEFHLREIQPDHATADPWGLLAYIQYAPPLADQVLHAMQMQYPQGIEGTPLLLLSDVLYGLQRLIKDEKMTNEVDADLIEILRCPITRSRLRQQGDYLIAEVGGLAFPVREGIPVMLAEEAKLPGGVSSLDDFKRQFAVK